MKKLRIIDSRNTKEKQWNITIEFEEESIQHRESYTIDINYFFCAKGLLDWYYSVYLLRPFGIHYKKAQQVQSLLIDNGKSLAHKLFSGEIVTILEQMDLADLVVSIESQSADFFSFQWETLYSPALNKPLSTVSSAFVRTETSFNSMPMCLNFSTENPIKILFISPRPNDCIDNPLCSNPEQMMSGLMELGDAVHVEQLITPSFSELKTRLDRFSEHPVHLIYFNGYIENKDDSMAIVFEALDGSTDCIEDNLFAELIGKHGIEIVFLDTAPYLVANQENQESFCPRCEPHILQKKGICNVVTTQFGIYTVYAQRFYSLLLSALAAGESLSRSIVKTRSTMREHSSQSVLTVQPLEFLDWPLVNHYSTQDIILFSEPLTLRSSSENPQYQEVLKNIVGFRQELLFGAFLGRTDEMRQIDRVLASNQPAEVIGNDGVGKTFFVHHYIFRHLNANSSKKVFYFDFKAHHYTKESITQIMQHVLEPDSSKDLESDLFVKNDRYLIVLDNMDAAQFRDDAEQEELAQFIASVSASGSGVITVNSNTLHTKTKLYLKGLNVYDRRQYACSILRQNKEDDAEEIYGYFDLIDALDGHPFMMQILLPMLTEQDPQEIQQQFFIKLKNITGSQDIYNDKAVLALFSYGWDLIDPDSKRILLAFKNYQGYFTEGMIINADKKNQPSSKTELFSLLNVDPDYSLTKVFMQGCKIGLMSKREFGYELHSKANSFLKRQSDENTQDEAKSVAIELAMCKLFMTELKMLCSFLQHHQDKTLYQIIIQNNSRWFNALSLLWRHHNYVIFNQGIDLLCTILSPVGLMPVFDAWCLEIIKQQQLRFSELNGHDGFASAWLKTAYYALGTPQVVHDPEISEYAHAWRKFLEQIEQVELFNHALMFLEQFYRKKEDWEARKLLSIEAMEFYKKNTAYERLISSMRSLAKCEEELGNTAAARNVEQQILDEIPYDALTQEARLESLLAIVINKVRRKEYQESKNLINELKALPDSESYHFIADALLADVLFKSEEHIDAVHVYAHLWETILQKKTQSANRNEFALIEARLKQLVDLLGSEVFAREFRSIAPDLKIPFVDEHVID